MPERFAPTRPKKSWAEKQAAAKRKALGRHNKVVTETGTPGHVLGPRDIPRLRWRTDLVDPVVSFVVYGYPVTQGSHHIKWAHGKPYVAANNEEGLTKWRAAVRAMSIKALEDWQTRTGKPWAPFDEAVLVSPVITVDPKNANAVKKKSPVYALAAPDVDKLQRAIGDSIAPKPLGPKDGAGMNEATKKQVRDKLMDARRAQALVWDDSRINWDHAIKVYPSTHPESLGYPGVVIRLWRIHDLETAARRPIITTPDGATWATWADLRSWTEPASGETWSELATRLSTAPVTPATGPLVVTGRGVDDPTAAAIMHGFMAYGPTGKTPVLCTEV